MRQVRGHIAGHRKRARLFRRAALRAGAPRARDSHRLLRPRRQGHADPAAHAAEGSADERLAHPAPRDTISAAIQAAVGEGPSGAGGISHRGISDAAQASRTISPPSRQVCDVVEIGVPFTDPMADGTTVQRASFAALADGVTLPWILEEFKSLQPRHAAPILLMSYLNPLLSLGLERCRGMRPRPASPDSSCRICPSRKAAISNRPSTRGTRAGADGDAGHAAGAAGHAVPRGQGFRVCRHHDGHHRSKGRPRKCRPTCSSTWIGSSAAPACRCARASASAPASRWRASRATSTASWWAPPWWRPWSAAKTSGPS